MRRLGWVALALVFMMSTDALAPPAYAKRVALVVGINKYDKLPHERQLVKAVNDARAIEVALKSVGFDVIDDVGRSAFNLAWQQLLNKLSPGVATRPQRYAAGAAYLNLRAGHPKSLSFEVRRGSHGSRAHTSRPQGSGLGPDNLRPGFD
jgi:hypothetical protein